MGYAYEARTVHQSHSRLGDVVDDVAGLLEGEGQDLLTRGVVDAVLHHLLTHTTHAGRSALGISAPNEMKTQSGIKS